MANVAVSKKINTTNFITISILNGWVLRDQYSKLNVMSSALKCLVMI